MTISSTGVDVSLNIGESVTFKSSVGLGISSVPFKPTGNPGDNDASFTVGLTYNNFDFGFKNGTPYFDTSAPDELQFTIDSTLPSFQAGLGFLNVNVTNNKANTTETNPDLHLTFSADINSSSGISDPKIAGNVDLNLHLASLESPNLPEVQADMVLKWTLPTSGVSPLAALGPGWGTPALAFDNVQVNIGSVLGDIVAPIADRAEQILQPLQPLFDLMQKPIPGLSALSQSMGGDPINLLSFSTVLSALPDPPTGLLNVLNSVERLQTMSQTAQHLASLSNKWIRIGDYNITGQAGGSLLTEAASAVGLSLSADQLKRSTIGRAWSSMPWIASISTASSKRFAMREETPSAIK